VEGLAKVGEAGALTHVSVPQASATDEGGRRFTLLTERDIKGPT